ncbi:MAG: hypothetical protein QW806_02590 [Nitrososphaerota archaeon]
MKKVSLYLNEELWIRFKEAVLKKHGTLRKLSDEVENLLRASMIDEEIEKAFKNMGINVKTVFSPEEVKRNRPQLRGPPSEVLIKKMRGRRVEGLPR